MALPLLLTGLLTLTALNTKVRNAFLKFKNISSRGSVVPMGSSSSKF